MRGSIPVILKSELVNGAANEASSVDKAKPISAYLKAHVSFVPSPQNETKFLSSDLINPIRSPLFVGFILA